jgi:hypothetical protein
MGNDAAQITLFDDLPERDRSPLRARWWGVALALHAALLLLPLTWYDRPDPQPVPEPVTVTIFTPPSAREPEPRAPIDPVVPPAPQELAEPPIAVPEEVARETPPAPPEPASDPGKVETPPPEVAEEPPSFEVQRLLETVAAMDWSEPEAETRTLGRATESEITEWLRQPVLAQENNTFDGMAAPTEVEITDRWMSPGGETNVVIRAPDGNTYCGRQGPVDDLRPWLQMPMLFHRCAGGGKRSSGTSWRNN